MTPNLSITLKKLERKNSSSWTGDRSGNQDALRTRADPFALYIARMHRKIHSLWGYGFLVVLSDADDPLNNMDLMANGSVDKAGIVD